MAWMAWIAKNVRYLNQAYHPKIFDILNRGKKFKAICRILQNREICPYAPTSSFLYLPVADLFAETKVMPCKFGQMESTVCGIPPN